MSNKEFLSDFIEVYRQHTCLWKVKSPHYAKRNLKRAGYAALIEVCKQYRINGTEEMVKKKIQSLRSAFRKEYNKQQKSIRSGCEAEDVYMPNLWYFNLLMFTKDQDLEEASCSISNMSSPGVFSEDDENTNDIDNKEGIEEIDLDDIDGSITESQNLGSRELENMDKMQIDVLDTRISRSSTPQSSNTSINPPFIPRDRQTRKKQKREHSSEHKKFLKVYTNALVNATHHKESLDDSTAFGTYVGTKLKTITDISQKMYAETLITQILQGAVMNKLSENTVVVDQTSLNILSDSGQILLKKNI